MNVLTVLMDYDSKEDLVKIKPGSESLDNNNKNNNNRPRCLDILAELWDFPERVNKLFMIRPFSAIQTKEYIKSRALFAAYTKEVSVCLYFSYNHCKDILPFCRNLFFGLCS